MKHLSYIFQESVDIYSFKILKKYVAIADNLDHRLFSLLFILCEDG